MEKIHRREEGYAIIITLVLAAALMISLGVAISMLGTLRKQDNRERRALEKRAEAVAKLHQDARE